MSVAIEVAVVLLTLALLKFLGDSFAARRRNTLLIPPGPIGLPILGSLLSIPPHAPWKLYAAWSSKYKSDLVSLRILGQLSIIINTKRAAKELYERRSAMYADRPLTTMMELMGWDFAPAVMPYNDEWRAQRRIFHQSMNVKAVTVHCPIQLAKVEILLRNIYAHPENLVEHIRHYAASVALAVAYGYDIEPENDYFVEIAEKAVNMFSSSIFPGSMVVNALPIRMSLLGSAGLGQTLIRHLPEWLPGTGFKTYARECLVMSTEMMEAPFAFAKRSIAEGTARPSMASTHTELNNARGAGPEGERVLKRTLATVYAAGADTTVSSLVTGILALVLHPTIQQRAQAEIDHVVGRGRFPTFEDRPSLPYVSAICREILRWQVTLPLTFAHSPMDDDVYEGMFIPKGTPIIVNAWAILNDPETYPNPEAFDPERFLTKDGSLNDDEVQAAYGFGRRNCIGQHLANNTIWIMMASLLAAFSITKAKDEHGNEIPVDVAYTDGGIIHSRPFQYSIRPRDSETEELMQQIGR
ncbi:cytochrome P450 [Artomyces pyxidatus]|uniref:Cytochrome P450 n=1 Tax=Artomyces pyxidatus TaxID=48021 RepID=A0ACB8SV14_9AGAM|nr:cytochrome P450 [Artomyces pyxidatus]